MSRFAQLGANQQGALLLVVSAFGATINSTLAKLLANGGMDPFQISLARAFFAFGALLPFLLRGGIQRFRTRHPWVHFWRATVGSAAMFLGIYAVAHLPLATVTALSFTTPLFTVLLAAVLLKEKVRWRRWTATGVGFAGVLMMVRPGAEAFDPNALAALTAALFVALAATLVKRFPPGESQAVMLFYFCVTSLLVAIVPAIAVWREPTWREWLLLAGVGLVGVTAHALFLKAFRTGEASFIAPFDYTKLVFALLIGFLLFDEVPDAWTLGGAAVIVASTFYIARREARQARLARAAQPPTAQPQAAQPPAAQPPIARPPAT